MKVSGLNFGFDDIPLLRDIAFELQPGLTALIGPNGSGKTTLIRLLSGYLKPSSGHIEINEQDIGKWSSKKLAQKIAVMNQEEELPFPLTVLEYVLLGLMPHEENYFASARLQEQARTTLNEVGALHWQHRLVQTLSGGEKQRVAMARALVQNPDILLLDEPVSHLDWSWQKKSLELIRHFGQNRIVVSVIHDPNLVSFYFDSVLMLKKGTLVAAGSVRDLLNQQKLKEVFEVDFDVYSNASGHNLFMPHG